MLLDDGITQPPDSDVFEDMIRHIANSKAEERIHPLAEEKVSAFSDLLFANMDSLEPDQTHFIWCSIQNILATCHIQADGPLLRLMFILVMYGRWLEQTDGLPKSE